VIRLWNRVGIFRTLSVLLLAGGIAGGVLVGSDRQSQRSSESGPVAFDTQALPNGLAEEREREDRASRGDAQRKADEAAVAAAAQAKAAETAPQPKTPPPPRSSYPVPASCAVYSGHRATGCAMMLGAGYPLSEFPCLEKLWSRESGWNVYAKNKSSGAYGIPQALPPEKMGAGWQNDPVVQIRWGLGYIKGRYKTPCGAWGYFQSHGWY